MHQKVLDKLKTVNKNQILIGVAVLAIIVTGGLVSAKSNPGLSNALSFLKPGMSTNAIAQKSIAYLNKSVLQNGQTATLDSVSEESGLVKIKIKIADKTYDSYATKDGKLLFPEAFSIESAVKNPTTAQNTQNNTAQAPTQNNKGEITPATVAKVAKSSLDTFIVSSCPFGLQAVVSFQHP